MDRLNSSVLKKIVEFYQEYLRDRLVSIILFGSHARGDAKETSDYDLFIIAEGLPLRPFQRLLFIRKPLQGQFEKRLCIIAKTREEVLNNFPPMFLDLGLDGVILFDREDFFNHLQIRIKEIIHQAGLEREKSDGEFYWEWKKPPQKGWEITWSGYREL
jgi:predicted nucleotidyltransferase